MSSAPYWAQEAPYLRKGNVEGNLFLGGSYGADSWRGMGGGNLAYAVNRHVMPYFEYSYFPGIGREVTTGAGNVRFSLPLSDIHAGVHYRLPFGQKGFVPYLVAGAGGVHTSSTKYRFAVSSGLPGSPLIYQDQVVPSDTAFAANFGGGIRYYVFGESSGFRTEFKVYVPRGAYTDPFYKATVGVFYQFR